jgi:riboflavin synthase
VFTGLVTDCGRLSEIDRSPSGARLRIESRLAGQLRDGDSVAVNGVCLTATTISPGSVAAEAMNETLHRTTLGELRTGDPVNLELPLRAGDPLGGHMVQGHVDGVGRVAALDDDGFARRVRIEAPEQLLRYVVEKGSIAVDGVSLTVVEVDTRSFTVSLIPETLERTNLGNAQVGRNVNLEVDVLAKYVEKSVQAGLEASRR